jgi:hypothetical protein
MCCIPVPSIFRASPLPSARARSRPPGVVLPPGGCSLNAGPAIAAAQLKNVPGLSRMPDAVGLRLRAIRYLAMAFKAREDGEADFATRLAERATELLEEAVTLANCSTPELEESPEPGERLHPAFGQVIIPPRPR